MNINAIENLEAIEAIDLDAPGPIGILPGSRIVTDEEGFPGPEVKWLSGEGAEVLLEVLDATFRSIYQHLQFTEGQESTHTTEALIELVGQAAYKMEKYLSIRLGKETDKLTERPTYLALQEYYRQKISEKAREEEAIEEGLHDMEAVRRDLDYEFFYIRHEDGTPHYNLEILRHMRLACDFDADYDTFEEDPLLQIRAMRDRDVHFSASQILTSVRPLVEDLFRFYRKMHENRLAQTLSQAVMALFLAANPRNLLQNTTGKTCLQYFEDFHYFLRHAFKTTEYQKLIAYPPEKSDKLSPMLLQLAHSLSYSLFHRAGGIKQEAIGLIHRTTRRGTEQKQAVLKKADSLWNQFLIEDENLRTLLSKFPSGPLFKTLDLLREEKSETQPLCFDPLVQQNLPCKLFEIGCRGKPLEILHLPSPTRQAVLNKVEIIDEFRGMLREIATHQPPRQHLLINLQDRIAWKEATRSRALESLQKTAEFNPLLAVITCPKNTDFYHQAKAFESLDQASEFKAALQKLLTHPEGGFYFPSSLKPSELEGFTQTAISFLHTQVFENKPSLTRREREDFIELFYQLLVLKIVEQYEPSSLSFTCKDALDVGGAETAAFYAFLKLITTDLSQKEAQDVFRWLLYTPALFVRERAISPERLTRILTFLERLDTVLLARGKTVLRELESLYRPGTLKGLQIP